MVPLSEGGDPVFERRAVEHVGDELVALEPRPSLLGGVEEPCRPSRALCLVKLTTARDC